MKVPYIINENTKIVYTPSPQSLDLVGENTRKLVAENFQWDANLCPSLEDFCVESIAKNFKEKQFLDELPCSDRVRLIEILPVDLPLELVIPLIHDEYYWQRRYKETFGFVLRHKPIGWTWKGLFLERHVQQLVEQAQPQYSDEETFDEILTLCCPYVDRLFVEQLQMWKPPLTMDKDDIPEEYPVEHINMTPIFKKLSNLVEFDLIYGMKNVGEDFNWNMFKVSVADCQKLGRALLELKSLRILRIHRCNLEYKHCQALMQNLIKHKNIGELDLSNCDIGDFGALCVAQLLLDGSTLRVLSLANNRIGKVGAEGIGFAMLSGNCEYLTTLNLKMNQLGTEGAMGIMRALVRCTVPKQLSLASCLFEEDTALKVGQMLKLNESLNGLDVSCNWFGESGGEELVQAMSENTSIKWLDVRETDISQEQQTKIKEYLMRNKKLDNPDDHNEETEEEFHFFNL